MIGNEHALVQSRLRSTQLESEVAAQRAQFQLDEVERLDKSLKEAKIHHGRTLKQSHEVASTGLVYVLIASGCRSGREVSRAFSGELM